jgi:hypothetical protein
VSRTLACPSESPLAEVTVGFDVISDDESAEGLADLYIEFACLDWASIEWLRLAPQ